MQYSIKISGFDFLQKKGLQSTTLDSVLLADFVKINSKSKQILEIGSGFGYISMILARKSKAKITGVEINKEAFEISNINLKNNNIENVNFLNCDILKYREYFKEQSFDIIVSNPPYFKIENENQKKKNKDLNLARVEEDLSIEEIIKISNVLLKNNASLFLIFRSERLAEIISYFKGTKLVLKRLKTIYTKYNSDRSLMCMIEAIKFSKEGLIIEKPIYIYDDNNKRSEYIENLYR